MITIGLILEPLDTLFFRGGRPFGAGLPGESGQPTPQAFAGAIRTFLLEKVGANFESMRGKATTAEAFAAAGAPWLSHASFRGPWLADVSNASAPKPYLYAPADVVLNGKQPARLRPLRTKLPGWEPPEAGMLPLWLKGARAGKDRPGWLTFDGLSAYLQDQILRPHHFQPADRLYELEERTGITVDEQKQAAGDSLIYSTRALRLCQQVGFYGEVDLPDHAVALFAGEEAIPWGGERHHVVVRRVNPVRWPEATVGERTSLMLVAPAFFAAGWRPDGLPTGTLIAAAVDGPFVVSGWDLARCGPKPTRFGVAAGSVYFVENRQPPAGTLAAGEDAQLGYGHFLRGTWNYAQ
jgi:CRISPR-associated protein Cmr3